MTDAPTPQLSLRGLTRVYGEGPTRVDALTDIDLDVAPGELVAVMGPSGSGKTTLLNLAGGLDTPTRGSVLVDGDALEALTARQRAALRRRRIGYVFQDFNLIPSLTAAENVSLPLELDGLPPREARPLTTAALDDVGLSDRADRFPEQLSGGQRQRVAIARALVGPRRLILADEPTGALDSTTGEDVVALLRDRVDQGAAGLLVTHDSRYAAWADRTVFLRDGRVATSTGGRLGLEALITADTEGGV
ncbi:ATP-binding cassette domain-containing protein [Nocardiopsis lucentensis]|uniref:ATP-binding cassette domain-containing protein n=1 Tax=Nocardiopsis lucentensis TaxID=53441 RepID=UPI000345CDB1